MSLLKAFTKKSPSAKDYLKQKMMLSELSFLNIFGLYTLETRILHVLGSAMNMCELI